MSGPYLTGSYGFSATPTLGRPLGHPVTSEKSCDYPGLAPSTPLWALTARPPKPDAARRRADTAAARRAARRPAGRLARGGRRCRLKIQATWPRAQAITAAWQRIDALPRSPDQPQTAPATQEGQPRVRGTPGRPACQPGHRHARPQNPCRKTRPGTAQRQPSTPVKDQGWMRPNGCWVPHPRTHKHPSQGALSLPIGRHETSLSASKFRLSFPSSLPPFLPSGTLLPLTATIMNR